MSSSHLVIVARNLKTGEVQFPLGDMTLYGTGEERSVLESTSRLFDDDWVLSLYRPTGDDLTGKRKPRKEAE